MISRLRLYLIFLVLSAIVMDCPAEIKWLNNNIDFGSVKESDGLIHKEFRGINIGNEADLIMNVATSCGCTSVEFPKDKVLPGDTAIIRFSFDPSGRPGRNEKTLKVFSSGSQGPERLTFSCVVKASEETLDKRFPNGGGGLRAESSELNIGEMKTNGRRYAFVGLYNQTESPVSPVFYCDDKDVEVSIAPQTIGPDETSLMTIYIHGNREIKNGLQTYLIKEKPTERDKEGLEIKLSVIWVPEVSGPVKRQD